MTLMLSRAPQYPRPQSATGRHISGASININNNTLQKKWGRKRNPNLTGYSQSASAKVMGLAIRATLGSEVRATRH